jgi:hypothetical protein
MQHRPPRNKRYAEAAAAACILGGLLLAAGFAFYQLILVILERQ